MKERHLSHRKVSDRSGSQISHSTVADIANGQRLNPNKDTLIALSKGLDIPADDLFRVVQGFKSELPEDVYELYAERFDEHGLGPSEWQFLEQYFREYVQKYVEFKDGIKRIAISEAPSRKTLAPVVARISSPKSETEQSRDEVRRMINADDEAEIKKRITPRKKKTG